METLSADAHQNILEELKQREPLFHHPQFGRTRAELEKMTDVNFCEVGASGRQYSREFVLDEVAKRYENPQYMGVDSPPENLWEKKDFRCLEIAVNNYLLTYTLVQGPRVTRRATIWRFTDFGWKILYHQGTVVENT